ncbi:MAG TPA: hypothetical protein VHZ24_13915 [Pirellulales bacterium]|nr:hypothetical protein [Pirellulales bacterium]
MFYITNTSTYSALSGTPDATDGSTVPPTGSSSSLLPSATINLGLPGSSFTPLSSSGSPYNGMLLFQRRQDRRPIFFIQQSLIGSSTLQGTIYARWGHVLYAGGGSIQAQIVSGTMRIVALFDVNVNPSSPLPPAEDVFLVE